MNILIIATNRSRQPVSVIPFGACLVAQSVYNSGHRVKLLDMMFEPDPYGAAQRAINGFKPDVVGVSVRNLDNNDMRDTSEYVSDLVALVRTLKRYSDAPIVLGGSAVGLMPEGLLRDLTAQQAADLLAFLESLR